MAAKKTATKKSTSKTTTPRKAAAPKPAKTSSAETAAKTKPATKAKAPAKKKPLKLSEAQEKILRQIDGAGESGYVPSQKTELRSIDKLRELKLVKKGAKDKTTGAIPFMTTAAGKKHLAAS